MSTCVLGKHVQFGRMPSPEPEHQSVCMQDNFGWDIWSLPHVTGFRQRITFVRYSTPSTFDASAHVTGASDTMNVLMEVTHSRLEEVFQRHHILLTITRTHARKTNCTPLLRQGATPKRGNNLRNFNPEKGNLRNMGIHAFRSLRKTKECASRHFVKNCYWEKEKHSSNKREKSHFRQGTRKKRVARRVSTAFTTNWLYL